MKKKLNKKLMCYIYTSNSAGRLAELADAHALGACGVPHKSSTLLSPTRKSNNSGIDRQGSFNSFEIYRVYQIKICCSECCIDDKMLQSRKGMYRGV